MRATCAPKTPVYMCDSSDRRRLDEACEELALLLEEGELAGVPVLVYANKQDLLHAMPAAEVMEGLELTGSTDRWIHVQACSAKTGENLDTGLQKLITKVQERSNV